MSQIAIRYDRHKKNFAPFHSRFRNISSAIVKSSDPVKLYEKLD